MSDERADKTNPPMEGSVSIAGTAPGIPDDALAPGETLPEPPSDEEVRRIERALEAHGHEDDLPLEGQ